LDPRLQAQLLVRVHRAESAELGPLAHNVGRFAEHCRDCLQRSALALARRPDRAGNLVAGSQPILADQALAYVNVTLGWEVAGLAAAEETTPPAGYV
jgi:hypothetical protein